MSGFSRLSWILFLGYLNSVIIILWATGHYGDALHGAIATAGSFVLGLYYSACDRAEGYK